MTKRTLNQPSALSRRIAKRLIEAGVIMGNFEDFRLERIYGGHWMRSQGCWSWELFHVDGTPTGVGSQFTASLLASTPEWDISTDRGGTNIDPVGWK